MNVPCSTQLATVLVAACAVAAVADETWPQNLRVVLKNTSTLKSDRHDRLPLYVLPISNALASLDAKQAATALAQLDKRGIGYTTDWNHRDFDRSLAEGVRIARMQETLGQPIAVNANACLYSFFDGGEETLHLSSDGERFAETSFGGKLGCPFALQHRVPVIKDRVEQFLRGYQQHGVSVDFIFADWEIDGPIEWNDAWETSKRCVRCREHIPDIDDFRSFQSRLRQIRAHIQRVAFGENVTDYFPEALVGNYGTYPHNGIRYWYDYFEKLPKGAPTVRDQRARYREWAHEFAGTGYSFAMPVVYTWYPTFHWYDFADDEFRWFYNMLRVGSNAGEHTDSETPIIPFVHWTTTSPPKDPDPSVRQLSKAAYKELLWHLLLRGHDTFFLWCVTDELADEVSLVHEVYAESLKYSGFLNRGKPVSFHVPSKPTDVVSGVRLGSKVLARRTGFAEGSQQPIRLDLGNGAGVQVRAVEGLQVLSVEERREKTGLLKEGTLFPIGFYEMPATDAGLKAMADAGVNLIRCGNSTALDRAHAVGMMGWMPLGLQQGPTPAFRAQVESVLDHPALAVWEGPDEIIWTFTAYSFLKERAGFTRDDWNDQKKIAVDYSEREAAKIMPAMRDAVQLVRELDTRNRPMWINEAADSDVRFARQYMPYIDITGCDYYAVRSAGTDLQSVGRLVDRWHAIGRGKPVWMVLQAFSWHAIKPPRERLYPSFAQSRFMAYDSIVHGAKGILYWGSNTIDDEAFRRSLYALISELDALQPFLVENAIEGVSAVTIDDLFDVPAIHGVRTKLLRRGNDYLLILVNEDNHRRLGVDVTGVSMLDGRRFSLLYGDEQVEVAEGSFVTRMQPYDVKVFATNAERFESKRREGRAYASSPR